ncbi:P-loop containing nucleoside triphosphate hydrolase protein [Rhizophagus diaphanus]|nr:P-loop containing nucleoside triphosphate hydrolase protein [Rhizophagus diaphanus] [Rhizophagus sp. MUCL 43196]
MKVSNPPIEEQYPTIEEKPLLILITGGAASGKTTFTQQLREYLEQNQQKAWEELNKDLEALLAGKSIYLPIYENSRERKFTRSITLINSFPIIIIEGMLSFFNKEIREKSPLKIYLEVSEKTRLERRLARYKKGLEEGRFTKPVEYEIERFYKGKPKENQETYVEPVKTYADLVINYDNYNYERKVEKVIGEIREKLK